MADVELENVTKRFGRKVVAVDDVSLRIEDGEFLVLVGPSGCGKTTTLRMVAGLETADEGEIRIAGERVNERSPKDRDIAMVFQNYALYSHFDVRGNLAFGLRARGTPRREIQARVERAARMLELDDVLDRRVRQLSGGQRQRVALGRAIVREPHAFLMDEPLSNLDALLRIQMRKEIIELTRRLDSTVMYVTHDQTEAMTMGERIAVMHEGRIQQLGPPDELYNRPTNRFVAGFIGSPPMNLLTTQVRADGGSVRLASGAFRSVAPPEVRGRDEVDVGVRAEDWVIVGDGEDGFPADVSVVELLGSDALVYATAGDHSLSLLVPGDARPRVGEQLRLRPRPDRMHFFDPDTGERLEASVSPRA